MLRAAVAKGAHQPARLVRAFATVPDFKYEPLIQNASPDVTPYRKLTSDYVSTIEVDGRQVCTLPRTILPRGSQL